MELESAAQRDSTGTHWQLASLFYAPHTPLPHAPLTRWHYSTGSSHRGMTDYAAQGYNCIWCWPSPRASPRKEHSLSQAERVDFLGCQLSRYTQLLPGHCFQEFPQQPHMPGFTIRPQNAVEHWERKQVWVTNIRAHGSHPAGIGV